MLVLLGGKHPAGMSGRVHDLFLLPEHLRRAPAVAGAGESAAGGRHAHEKPSGTESFHTGAWMTDGI